MPAMKAANAKKATVMLMENKKGKLVSKKRSAHGRKHPWLAAVMAARLALNIEGFWLVRKSSAVYKKAMSAYTTYKKAKQYWKHPRLERFSFIQCCSDRPWDYDSDDGVSVW